MQPKCHKAWHFSSLSCVQASKLSGSFKNYMTITPFFEQTSYLTAFTKSFPLPWTRLYHKMMTLLAFNDLPRPSTWALASSSAPVCSWLPTNKKRGVQLTDCRRIYRFLNGLLGGMKLSLTWSRKVTKCDEKKGPTPASTIPKMTCKNHLCQDQKSAKNVSGWMVPPILVAAFQAGWISSVLLRGPESLQVLRKWGLFDLFSLRFRLCVVGDASVLSSLSLTNGCWISEHVLLYSSGHK